ncbi:MAG: aspartate-semialdehyde dehydrogenase [Gemmatimonadales bacterium]
MIRVGILGATGMVGQQLVRLLEGHPWFRVTALAASERSQGRPYAEACGWRMTTAMPAWAVAMPVVPPAPPLDCDIVLSGLPADSARVAEPAFVAAGVPVITNSSPHRMDQDVPLVVPEVNADAVSAVKGRRGFIVANPNCTAAGIAVALAPLHVAFGVEEVLAATMQALSGAGFPGVASLDVTDNVLPYIAGEEEKIPRELNKILGASMTMSVQCHRVSVRDGHLAALWIKCAQQPSVGAVKDALRSFRASAEVAALPSAPAESIVVRDEPDRPQPVLDRDAGNGMAVTVGRIMTDGAWLRLLVLSHNTVRGAAGAAILNAELLKARGLIG